MCKLVPWLVLAISILANSASAWGPSAHNRIGTSMLNYWTVAPFLSQYGLSASGIGGRAWEGDTSTYKNTFHEPQWEMLRDRRFLFDPKWGTVDESTRLALMLHNAGDSGVPANHSPAGYVYVDNITEPALEARVDTWPASDFPGINPYTGTYGDQMNTFYSQCIANATMFRDHHNFFNSDYGNAGTAGLAYGQQVGVAMLVNYFLAKAPSVANANGSYAVNPGGNVTFNSSGSYDPDSVTTNSGGSYYQNWTGITNYSWDLNNDGAYETSGASPTLSYSQLYSLVGPTEGKTIRLRVQDDEGSTYLDSYNNAGVATATATIAVYTPPVAGGRAEYGWLGKPGDVPSDWDWDNMLGSGSNDPDGGFMTSYAWDLNNDGVYEKTGGASTVVSYNDFTALGITANESQTVTLRVTDNEGATATQSGISMPVLVNPNLSLATTAELAAGHSLNLTPSGYDSDGGAIAKWEWDLNNDGTFTDFIGQALNLSYTDLMALGLHFGQNTIHLRITDDDSLITNGWAGTASRDLQLTLDTPMIGDATYDGLVNVADLTALLNSYNTAGGWGTGDFNSDGIVNVADLTALLNHYNQSSLAGVDLANATAAVPEPSGIAMFVTLSLVGGVWMGRRRRRRNPATAACSS